MRELRRRRHRRKKLNILERKVKAAKPSELEPLKNKIRKLTTGADDIFTNWKIAD